MSEQPEHREGNHEAARPPRPVVKKMRWPFPIIWIVPVAAAILAGYYLYQHHQETGTQITIEFEDGAGIKPGETTVAMHGVTIGHVKSVELSHDHQRAVAHVQLQTSVAFLACEGTAFWMVRPEISVQNVTGLSTLVSGPYIDCRPGGGAAKTEFAGLTRAPMASPEGVRIILSADRIAQLSVDSPVTFRGIQVGVVKDIRLSNRAEAVNVTVLVWERYRTLVRMNSQFWQLKGADIEGSLLGGVKVQLGSVQNILSGGIGFATPEKNYGLMATEGTAFELHDSTEDAWLKWKAVIPLASGEPGDEDQKAPMAEDKKLPSVVKKP